VGVRIVKLQRKSDENMMKMLHQLAVFSEKETAKLKIKKK